MVHYKLYYFPLKGFGEPIRLLLTYAGVQFEDIRYSQDDWPKHKADMPLGQMPVLEVDGKKLTQSMTIGRFLAEKHGLLPKDEWQRVKADELVTAIMDLPTKVGPVMAITDKEAKKAKYDETMKDFIYPRLKFYEHHLSASKSGFVADEVCWADFYVYNFFKLMIHFWHPKMDDYPKIKAYMAKVESLPQIKAWIEKYHDMPMAPMSIAADLGV